jgi:hypothetical protein
MSFNYDTMWAKFENLTGHNPGVFTLHLEEVKAAGCVSVQASTVDNGVNCEIRDWCEEHFGNDWIYNWNVYYFKYERDATLFSLRWT